MTPSKTLTAALALALGLAGCGGSKTRTITQTVTPMPTATAPQTTTATTPTATAPAPKPPAATTQTPETPTTQAPAACGSTGGHFIRAIQATGADCATARSVAGGWLAKVQGGADPAKTITVDGYVCAARFQGQLAVALCRSGPSRIAFSAHP